MVPHTAVCIDSTQAGARILAFPIDAGLVLGTVRVDGALWATVGRRANHVRQAGALAPLANDTRRIAVGSAGIGVARILSYHRLDGFGWQAAGCERIAHIARHTDTVGNVVDHLALCIGPTIGPRAGIHTFLLLACLIRRTLRIGGALRSTGHIRIAKVARHTLACCCCASGLANGIRATGRWVAGIYWFLNPRRY
jgi:hypothetical protein